MDMPLHGANPQGLYREFGVEVPACEILDFSTNTNVLPWDGDMDFDVARLMANYPDDESAELRGIIAARAGCASENVLVTNGSNEAVYLIASCFAGKRAFYLDPIYGEYRRACAAYGVAETAERFGGDVNFVCNPCNPTGTYIESAEMERLLREHADRHFVVDEAYLDFLRGSHAPLHIRQHPNLLTLRSLTKIFHLCGARIGYVLGSAEWIGRLKERQPTWSVNGLAQEACRRFLLSPDFIDRTRAFYAEETPRLIGQLAELGLEILPTETNFFLIRVHDDAEVIHGLLQRGIAVRHTRNFKGLDGGYIRVATRMPADNDRLIEAVAELTSTPGKGGF